MKKFLAITALLGSAVIFAPSIEAKPNAETTLNNSATPQINIRIGRQRNRRARVVNRTRIVRRGYATYRETWQYRYAANGRVTSRLISRVRVGR